MKTLVIHPYDTTTDFLFNIYADTSGWTIMTTDVSRKSLIENIKSHDRIVMLGHGTEEGLLGFGRFIIDSSMVYLLREKYCVCIWCYAKLFVEKYDLKGFYTDMFISEDMEANIFRVNSTVDEIIESNRLFALTVNKYIFKENMLESIKKEYVGESEVIKYNTIRLHHK